MKLSKALDHFSTVIYSEGEETLAQWSPRFLIYLTKILCVGALTALFFSFPNLSFHPLYFLFALPITTVLNVVMFEDINDWPNAKNAVWTLTNRQLIYENPVISDIGFSVPLSEIKSIKRRNLFFIVVRLKNNMAFDMAYLRARKDICKAIQNAQKEAGT